MRTASSWIGCAVRCNSERDMKEAKGLYLFNAPYCGRYDTDGRHHDEDTFGIVCREGLSPDSIRGKPVKVPSPRVDFPMPCD